MGRFAASRELWYSWVPLRFWKTLREPHEWCPGGRLVVGHLARDWCRYRCRSHRPYRAAPSAALVAVVPLFVSTGGLVPGC